MHRKELNERSPIRVFENSIHGGLGRGNLGVVVARHGVGKSAFLVGIALDDLMRGKQVLHVDIGKPMDHIREFYDEVFADLASTNHLEDAPEIRREIESHRHIKAFLANTFSVAKLRAHLAMMKEITGFAPGAVIIDDYDFAKSSAAEMADLRALARELDAEMWMSATTHRNVPRNEHGVPEPVAQHEPAIDVIVSLEADEKGIHVRLLKDHGNEDVPNVRLALDPTTMLLVQE